MRTMIRRIKVLLVKENIQALRDPRLRVLVFVPPLLQLVAFGYAANLDLKNIPIALYDEDNTPVSRELAFAFASSGYFKFVETIQRPDEMTTLIDKGTVSAVLHLGPDLAARVGGGRTALVQVIVAGHNSTPASLGQSYSLQIIERFNRARLKKRLEDNPPLRENIPAGSPGIGEAGLRGW